MRIAGQWGAHGRRSAPGHLSLGVRSRYPRICGLVAAAFIQFGLWANSNASPFLQLPTNEVISPDPASSAVLSISLEDDEARYNEPIALRTVPRIDDLDSIFSSSISPLSDTASPATSERLLPFVQTVSSRWKPPPLTQDETLKQALRSIVSSHISDPRPSVAHPENSNDNASVGLLELTLDSTTAGSILRSVTDVTSKDGGNTTFSILGAGEFSIEVMPNRSSLVISELSTGWSSSYQPPSAARQVGSVPNSEPKRDVDPGRGNAIQIVLAYVTDFLYSPAGVLLMMFTAIILIMRVVVRVMAAVRRTTQLYRHDL